MQNGKYYVEVCNEELVRRIYSNEQPEKAFEQLIINNRRTMILIGKKYLSKIPIYDIDDYIQEGSILLWKLLREKKYEIKEGGSFNSFFYKRFEYKCLNMYRDYVLKNLISLADYDYCEGHYSILVESQYAIEYREKKRMWDEAARRKKGVKPRHILTDEEREERKERSRQKSRERYYANRDKYIEAKRRWYRENREYALAYQREYDRKANLEKGIKPRPRLNLRPEEKKEHDRQRRREYYLTNREKILERQHKRYQEKKKKEKN